MLCIITCLVVYTSAPSTRTLLTAYPAPNSASMDGHLRLYEEGNGRLHLHHSLENAFGPGVGITRIKSVPSLSLIVATGACAVS
jgi:hypothetical protein